MNGLPSVCYQALDCVLSKYHPQAVILYGSFATGTWTDTSDIDLLCLVDDPEIDRLSLESKEMINFFHIPCGNMNHFDIEGREISISLYYSRKLSVTASMERSCQMAANGRVLYQENGLGDIFLERTLHGLHLKIPYRDDAKDQIRKQMRISLHDIQGDTSEDIFLAKSFLNESIRNATILCDCDMVGAKAFLRYLKIDAPDAYVLLVRALRPDAEISDIILWGEFLLEREFKVDFFNTDFSAIQTEKLREGGV